MHNEFTTYIIELLSICGDITSKRMFSGIGFFKNGLMFGFLSKDSLYFKASFDKAKFFKMQGSEQFTYSRHGKQIKLSYWRVMPEVFDDIELMRKWFTIAYSSAVQARTKHSFANKIKHCK